VTITVDPLPTADAGLIWCLSRWTDGELFTLGVKIVLGSAGENLPEDFAQDRGRLYLGDQWAEGLKQANDQLPHLVSQIRAPFSWLNEQLSDGRKFLLGDTPAAIDAQFYHVIWFIRGRWAGGPTMLSEFANLEQWEKNIEALGHGVSSTLSAEDAISVALAAEPSTELGVADNDPQGLAVGMKVTVHPDVNGGEQGVSGTIRMADENTIAIDRVSEKAGLVCVNFPRTGYRIET
jgi:glutathione S-transferase